MLTSTKACVKDTPEVLQMQSENHYITIEALVSFVTNVLDPHRQNVIKKKHLSANTKAILLLDCCSVHVGVKTRLKLLDECCETGKFPWLIILFVPARCTSRCQPMDVGWFGIFKPALRARRCIALLNYCRGLRLQQPPNERLPILFRIPDTNTTTVFVPAPDAEDDFEESPFEITDDRETTETAMVPTK